MTTASKRSARRTLFFGAVFAALALAPAAALAQAAPQPDPAQGGGPAGHARTGRGPDDAPGARPGARPGMRPGGALGDHAGAGRAAAQGSGEHGTERGAEHATDGAGHEEGAEGEEHEHGTPEFNFADFSNKKTPPYLAALINFALLAYLYVRLGKKPVAEALKNRRATVAKEIDDATRILKEAEARAKKYQAKLDSLDDDVDGAKKALAQAGEAEKTRITGEAQEKAVRMEKDARFLLDQEIRQMRLDLVRETVEEAVAAAEELLKKRVTMADQERLAEDFLRELAARSGPKSVAPGSSSGPPPSSAARSGAPSVPPFAVTGGDA